MESLATNHAACDSLQVNGVKAVERVPDCLTPKQLQALEEYIQSHLQSELALSDRPSAWAESLLSCIQGNNRIAATSVCAALSAAATQQLLRETQISIAAIAYEVGFGNQSRLCFAEY